ncbi:hypothetical protein CLV96_0319 [Leptospira meyeri]|uniref:Transposase n=2 Tax=Leptospira meyeri TaxID=29508 RepID=A0A4R8MUH4_LEPME|nr:hypothetical protein CLV96_0319 [Leptospira meyeri]
MARCSNCYKQVSITANTPLDRFKLPLSYFSYILENQILSYPKSYTSSEISRKLNLPYKASYRLKRRIQIFCSLLNDKLREQMYRELDEHYKKNPITLPKEGSYKEIAKENPVCVADSVILFSSSLRANSFRSRRYNTGTSSIYLSNSVRNGEQMGILCHTTGVVGKWTFYESLPLANSYYLQKDLESKIPKSAILWTDQGYEFLWDYKNHKSVNHSKRSNDPRYNMSRERWITKQGVTSNSAEAKNALIKGSFKAYQYITPRLSKLYMDEFSFLSNVRFAEHLRELLIGSSVCEGDKFYSPYLITKKFQISDFIYVPLTLEERTKLKNRKLINQYKEEDVSKYNKDYRSAILQNDYYWKFFNEKDRMKNEIEYNHRAFRIYNTIETRKWCDVDSLSRELELDKREVSFIIRKWSEYGIAEIIERKERYRKVIKFKVKNVKLYYLIYSNIKEGN